MVGGGSRGGGSHCVPGGVIAAWGLAPGGGAGADLESRRGATGRRTYLSTTAVLSASSLRS